MNRRPSRALAHGPAAEVGANTSRSLAAAAPPREVPTRVSVGRRDGQRVVDSRGAATVRRRDRDDRCSSHPAAARMSRSVAAPPSRAIVRSTGAGRAKRWSALTTARSGKGPVAVDEVVLLDDAFDRDGTAATAPCNDRKSGWGGRVGDDPEVSPATGPRPVAFSEQRCPISRSPRSKPCSSPKGSGQPRPRRLLRERDGVNHGHLPAAVVAVEYDRGRCRDPVFFSVHLVRLIENERH